ncbi:MAG TPA: preprotein translocase subunit YajC [Blastocatellia bacterium]|nr:preprotein translocase subunit YajC [Blastocatellia bacterium]
MNNNIALGFPLLLQAPTGGGGSGLLGTMLMMATIFAIFYLLVIRPQQRKQRLAQKEREELLNALKPGDKVVTSSGIYGTVVAVRESTVLLRIAQSVSIEVLRSAIQGLQSSEVKEAEPAK